MQIFTSVAATAAMRGHVLAKPNYQFEKRQRELEKKRKQEEKRQRDLAARSQPEGSAPEGAAEAPESTEAGGSGTAS